MKLIRLKKGAQATLVAHLGQYCFRFIGVEVALEAIWAHLNNVRVRRTGYTGLEDIHLADGVKYRRFRTRLPCGLDEMIVAHPMLLVTWAEDGFVILGEDEPPPGFFPRLNGKVQVPITREWAELLWQKGLKQKVDDRPYTSKKLIEEIAGEGMRGWKVNTEYTSAWHQVVKEIIHGE